MFAEHMTEAKAPAAASVQAESSQLEDTQELPIEYQIPASGLDNSNSFFADTSATQASSSARTSTSTLTSPNVSHGTAGTTGGETSDDSGIKDKGQSVLRITPIREVEERQDAPGSSPARCTAALALASMFRCKTAAGVPPEYDGGFAFPLNASPRWPNAERRAGIRSTDPVHLPRMGRECGAVEEEECGREQEGQLLQESSGGDGSEQWLARRKPKVPPEAFSSPDLNMVYGRRSDGFIGRIESPDESPIATKGRGKGRGRKRKNSLSDGADGGEEAHMTPVGKGTEGAERRNLLLSTEEKRATSCWRVACLSGTAGATAMDDITNQGPRGVWREGKSASQAAHDLMEEQDEEGTDQEYSQSSAGRGRAKPKDPGYNRKVKSLALLCERFVQRYSDPTLHSPSEGIGLDSAAQALGVERRRIYDIINILEAIVWVARRGKNTYTWFGQLFLMPTFKELQTEALLLWPEDARQHGLIVPPDTVNQVSKLLYDERKEKSLGRLCQKFISLFLIGYDVISLAGAAEKLLGATSGPQGTMNTDKSMKTKVRRLYDIANVLSSLRIIDKIMGPDNRKPSFQWMGPSPFLIQAEPPPLLGGPDGFRGAPGLKSTRLFEESLGPTHPQVNALTWGEREEGHVKSEGKSEVPSRRNTRTTRRKRPLKDVSAGATQDENHVSSTLPQSSSSPHASLLMPQPHPPSLVTASEDPVNRSSALPLAPQAFMPLPGKSSTMPQVPASNGTSTWSTNQPSNTCSSTTQSISSFKNLTPISPRPHEKNQGNIPLSTQTNPAMPLIPPQPERISTFGDTTSTDPTFYPHTASTLPMLPALIPRSSSIEHSHEDLPPFLYPNNSASETTHEGTGLPPGLSSDFRGISRYPSMTDSSHTLPFLPTGSTGSNSNTSLPTSPPHPPLSQDSPSGSDTQSRADVASLFPHHSTYPRALPPAKSWLSALNTTPAVAQV